MIWWFAERIWGDMNRWNHSSLFNKRERFLKQLIACAMLEISVEDHPIISTEAGYNYSAGKSLSRWSTRYYPIQYSPTKIKLLPTNRVRKWPFKQSEFLHNLTQQETLKMNVNILSSEEIVTQNKSSLPCLRWPFMAKKSWYFLYCTMAKEDTKIKTDLN